MGAEGRDSGHMLHTPISSAPGIPRTGCGLTSFLCLPARVSPCSGAGRMGGPNGSPAGTQGIPGSREASGVSLIGGTKMQGSGDSWLGRGSGWDGAPFWFHLYCLGLLTCQGAPELQPWKTATIERILNRVVRSRSSGCKLG